RRDARQEFIDQLPDQQLAALAQQAGVGAAGSRGIGYRHVQREARKLKRQFARGIRRRQLVFEDMVDIEQRRLAEADDVVQHRDVLGPRQSTVLATEQVLDRSQLVEQVVGRR